MSSRGDERGQGMVEFALAFVVFITILMGIVDLGRLVYQYNGVAETARALARETSVHPGSPLGSSTDTAGVLGTQRKLMPITGATYSCVDIAGTTVSGTCEPGDWVRVAVTSQFTPATPLATVLGSILLSSTASAKIE